MKFSDLIKGKQQEVQSIARVNKYMGRGFYNVTVGGKQMVLRAVNKEPMRKGSVAVITSGKGGTYLSGSPNKAVSGKSVMVFDK